MVNIFVLERCGKTEYKPNMNFALRFHDKAPRKSLPVELLDKKCVSLMLNNVCIKQRREEQENAIMYFKPFFLYRAFISKNVQTKIPESLFVY